MRFKFIPIPQLKMGKKTSIIAAIDAVLLLVTSPIYRTRPYMVIILRVFWLVTLKMPVTPVILLHNLYSSRHWQPTLFVLIVQVLNSASTTATTPCRHVTAINDNDNGPLQVAKDDNSSPVLFFFPVKKLQLRN